MRTLLTLIIVAMVLCLAAIPARPYVQADVGPVLPSAARTLARDADPVIVTGQQMPAFAGAPLNRPFVYAYTDGAWQQIPWQFDEIKNGHYAGQSWRR
jgi:hypothetical protein